MIKSRSGRLTSGVGHGRMPGLKSLVDIFVTLVLASRVTDILKTASTTVTIDTYVLVSIYTYQSTSIILSEQTMYIHVEKMK